MSQLSFLPMPPFNPKWPARHTLAYKALVLLLEGRKVSHPTFVAHTGSWRLAAHVFMLKRLGWPVEKDAIDYEPHDSETPNRHIGLYYLPPVLLNMIKGV